MSTIIRSRRRTPIGDVDPAMATIALGGDLFTFEGGDGPEPWAMDRGRERWDPARAEAVPVRVPCPTEVVWRVLEVEVGPARARALVALALSQTGERERELAILDAWIAEHRPVRA